MKLFTHHASIIILSHSILVNAAAPTFTFGPASNYAKAPKVTAAPQGKDLAITPGDFSGGIPKDGVDFFFGPDLVQGLSENMASGGVCANGPSQDCINDLTNLLNLNHKYELESRAVGLAAVVGAGIAALIGVIIEAIRVHSSSSASTALAHLHLESTDISQMQKLTSAPYIFSTASGVAPVTVSAVPTSTVTAAPARITKLAAKDGQGHDQGDVLIQIAPQPADLMKQLIDKYGGHDKCKNLTSAAKRAQHPGAGQGILNHNVMNSIGKSVLPMAAPQQLLAGLGIQSGQTCPPLRLAEDQSSLKLLQDAAASMNEFKDVSKDIVNSIAETVWGAVRQVCAYGASSVETIVFDEWIVDDSPNDDDKKCPTDPLKQPVCKDCAGISNKCLTGDQKGCRCLNTATAIRNTGYFKDFLNDQQQALKAGMGSGIDINSGTLVCGTSTDQGNAYGWADRDMMQKAANYFCQHLADTKSVYAPGTTANANEYVHYNNYDYDPIFIQMKWGDGPQCPTTDFSGPEAKQGCLDRFQTIIDNCDKDNPDNYYWSKQGGSFSSACLVWTVKRDNWYNSKGAGTPVEPRPDWLPATNQCQQDSDCPAPCKGGKNICRKEHVDTDLNWCRCNGPEGNP